jgi:acetyl-CoA carboxylase biotin carboxyl carrier protein
MELTEEEINQILRMIDESNFDELHLEMGDLKLTVVKSGHGTSIKQSIPAKVAHESVKTTELAEDTVAEQNTQKAEPGAKGVKPISPPAVKGGLMPIKAPMIGTFYKRPEPGSAPFVEIGSHVEENTTVCLLEVMKVFTAVKAGVRGYIREICAESGDLVEYGQPLFWVEPEKMKMRQRRKSGPDL